MREQVCIGEHLLKILLHLHLSPALPAASCHPQEHREEPARLTQARPGAGGGAQRIAGSCSGALIRENLHGVKRWDFKWDLRNELDLSLVRPPSQLGCWKLEPKDV